MVAGATLLTAGCGGAGDGGGGAAPAEAVRALEAGGYRSTLVARGSVDASRASQSAQATFEQSEQAIRGPRRGSVAHESPTRYEINNGWEDQAILFYDGALYVTVNGGGRWAQVEGVARKAVPVGGTLSEDAPEALEAAREVGTAAAGARTATVYRASIAKGNDEAILSPIAGTLGQAGARLGDAVQLAGATIEVAIDDASGDILRMRLEYAIELDAAGWAQRGALGGAYSGTVALKGTLVETFTDIGGSVTVTKPANAVPVSTVRELGQFALDAG
ncbi:MAG: hypothetical protein FJW92_01725 [Actinobacteria bacterium]|nr:hypothetical protein [Actinomycetota bacterium]